MKPPPCPTTVYVVEDDVGVRTTLRWLLSGADLKPVLLEDGAALRATLSQSRTPLRGVILLDLQLPGLDGLTLVNEGLCRDTHMPVIVLTAHADVPRTVELFTGGIFTLLEKPVDQQTLTEAVQAAQALEAERWQSLTEKVEARQRLASLTRREREILDVLLRGLSNKEVAELLELSPRTVETHRRNLLRKLEIRKITEAAWWVASIEVTPPPAE